MNAPAIAVRRPAIHVTGSTASGCSAKSAAARAAHSGEPPCRRTSPKSAAAATACQKIPCR
jgi:hypothetical protein